MSDQPALFATATIPRWDEHGPSLYPIITANYAPWPLEVRELPDPAHHFRGHDGDPGVRLVPTLVPDLAYTWRHQVDAQRFADEHGGEVVQVTL